MFQHIATRVRSMATRYNKCNAFIVIIYVVKNLQKIIIAVMFYKSWELH